MSVTETTTPVLLQDSVPDSFPQPGEIFMEKYRIERVLNRGGFGCVYKAMQQELNRAVAIKVLQPASRVGFQDDSAAEAKRLEIVTRRFEREAQLVSQLRDPNTVMVYDFGLTPGGLLYMVLEYVDGAPLNEVLENEGALGPERSVKIVKQVLSSLQEAHAFNMLHRDIKPANIMLFNHVGRRDQVKVLDFGLAKAIDDPHFTADNPDLTDAEVLIGTPRYMSPEQIRGYRLTPATDMYSLGLVFYELLTGDKAVDSKSTMNTLARHVNEEPIVLPDNVSLPNGLRSIVNRMLDKNAKRRLGSAEEVLKLLESWNSKEVLVPLPATALSEEIEVVEVVSAPPWLFAAVAAAAILLMLTTFVAFSGGGSSDPETPAVAQVPESQAKVSAPDELVVAEPEIEKVEVPSEPVQEEDPVVPEPAEELVEVAVPSPTIEKKIEPKQEKKVSNRTPDQKAPDKKLDFLRTLDSTP